MATKGDLITRLKDAKPVAEETHWDQEYVVQITSEQRNLLIQILEYLKIGGAQGLPKPSKTIYTLDNSSDIIE